MSETDPEGRGGSGGVGGNRGRVGGRKKKGSAAVAILRKNQRAAKRKGKRYDPTKSSFGVMGSKKGKKLSKSNKAAIGILRRNQRRKRK